ncbi:MAG: hypothetical protein M3P24_06025, partial [Gemmatimonadota bacterium]|nr:hypothetical protein [Gemmatimonadota bacterium]
MEDPRGKVSTWTRNEHGQVTHATTPAGGSTEYTWFGPNLTGIRNHAAGGYTEISYEPTYNQVERVWQDQVLQLTHFYGSRGQVDSVRVDTSVTRYTYDGRGRVTSVSDPEKHQTKVAYEPGGMQNTQSVTLVRGSETRTTSYGYDAHGRARTVTDPAQRVATTEYDALNRVKSTTGPENTTVAYGYDDPGRTYTVTDPKGQTYTTVTNALGWVESQTDPRNVAERFAYDRDGNVVTYTNRRQQQVNFTYDKLDRVLSRTADAKVTSYAYDPDDRWVEVKNEESTDTLRTDAAGRPTTAIALRGGTKYTLEYGYTDEGLRNSLLATGPWGKRSLVYGYDAVLRLDYLQDLGEKATGITYNQDQLPGTVTLPTGSTASERLRQSFGYTPLHAPEWIAYSRAGAQAALGRGYGYDVLERIEKITRASPAGGTETRTLAYDSLGRLKGYEDV